MRFWHESQKEGIVQILRNIYSLAGVADGQSIMTYSRWPTMQRSDISLVPALPNNVQQGGLNGPKKLRFVGGACGVGSICIGSLGNGVLGPKG
jgi:hypothetical protein